MSPARPTLVAAALLVSSLAAAPCSAQLPEASSFPTEWAGVFHSYPHIIELQVRLTGPVPGTGGTQEGAGTSTADRSSPPPSVGRRGDGSRRPQAAARTRLPTQTVPRVPNAVVRLMPVAEVRGIGRGQMGEYEARVEYDARTGEVMVIPSSDAYRVMGFRPPTLRGALDPNSGWIGGLIVNGPTDSSPYFVLAAPDTYRGEIREEMREAMEHWSASTPGSIIARFGSAPDKDELLAWASRVLEEFDVPRPSAVPHGQLELMTRNLLDDGHFTDVFGKPFEELSLRDKGAIQRRIQEVPRPRANFSEELPAELLYAVLRPLTGLSGTYGEQDMVVSVFGMRAIHRWKDAILDGLDDLVPAPGVIDRLHAVDTVGQRVLAFSWPSERERFVASLADARSDLAAPVLVAEVDLLIETAEGIGGARVLVSASRAEGPLGHLLAEVDAAIRTNEVERLQQHADRLLAGAVAEDRSGLSSLGSGLGSLAAGVEWYAAAQRRYVGLADRSPVQQLWTELAATREQAFPLARGALEAQIAAGQSARDVASVISRYLAVPSDQPDPVGGTLLSAARNRREALAAVEAQTRAARAEERRIANHLCSRTSPSPNPSDNQPSAREICFAIDAELQARMGSLSDTTGCHDIQDPITALLCMIAVTMGTGWGDPELSIGHFREVGCAPTLAENGSFFCDVELAFRSNNPFSGPLVNSMPPEVSTFLIVRESNGWRAVPNN